MLLDEAPKVLFDRVLILRRRGHDLRVGDRPVTIQPVPVEEHAVRRLRAGAAGSFNTVDVHGWL
jgi:hypothetical protein